MINARTVDHCLRRLDALADSTYRKDFRDTANMARKMIARLLAEKPAVVNLEAIAQQISEQAANRPVIVYRTKKTGAIRWQAAHTASVVRIPESQIVGTYNAGADWRNIWEDLAA